MRTFILFIVAVAVGCLSCVSMASATSSISKPGKTVIGVFCGSLEGEARTECEDGD